jgi:hypothetical protein
VSNCQYCNALINETLNFCVDCEKQVKCLNCRGYLLKDKSKCLSCGILINTTQSTATHMNTFSLEEEQSDTNYSRKLNLSFTDTAIDKVAIVLSGHVPLTPSTINPKRNFLDGKQPNLISVQQAALADSTQDETIETESIKIENHINTLQGNIAENYFDKDAQGYLISRTPDYKGKDKKTQQQRFLLLYVWAYYLFFQQFVAKDHLSQAAKINNIHESKNYSRYLGELSTKYLMNIDGALKLNPAGLSEVKKILSEIEDEEVKGIPYHNPSRKYTARGSKITKDISQKIDEWVHQSSRFAEFDVRNLSTAADYALLAIYDITKELKVQEHVKPVVAYTYLVQRYKIISIDQQNFSSVLSNKAYSKYFSCTSDRSYYLTQEGESTVEGWNNKEIIDN